MVVENRVEMIFGPWRVTEGWRRQHNEELHELYFSPNIRMIKARIIKWAGHVERRRARRNGYRVFYLGKPETKRPIGRPSRRWECNIVVKP
jgi:hypothetical protein